MTVLLWLIAVSLGTAYGYLVGKRHGERLAQQWNPPPEVHCAGEHTYYSIS